jgi:hypothetical protein
MAAAPTLGSMFGSISYSMIAYIFLCIIVGTTVPMKLMQSGRQTAALVCLVFFILIFVFYGMRWFNTNSLTNYTGSWPPIINTCPDYLLYYMRDKQPTCVDMIGVNRSGGLLKPWSKGDSPQNPPANDAKYFPYIYKAGMNAADVQNLCILAQQAGLTWEGITNGESCTYNPPSTVLGPTGSSTSCPPTVARV